MVSFIQVFHVKGFRKLNHPDIMISPLFSTALLASLLAFSPFNAFADTLQGLKDKSWASYYAGFQGAGIEMGVDTKGEVEFYFTPKKGDRLNRAWPIIANLKIERRTKGKEKWVRKSTKLDGFTTVGKPKLNEESIELISMVTGGTQFKVKFTFDKTGVNIQSEMFGIPLDSDKAEYRLILESQMPSLMEGSSKYDEKELKKKTRGDAVKIEFKKEKGEKIDLFEVFDGEKLTSKQPTSISLSADKIGRKALTWKMLDPKDKGAVDLELKSTSKRFLDGFDIKVTLVDEKSEQLSKGIRIEYK